MTSAEVLLHPVRLRIVQTFLGRRELTTADLRDALADVSPATLYRQVSTLAAAGVLVVSGERRIRGAVERSYRLQVERASVDAADAATMTAEEHRRAFMTFVARLLADFDRYLDAGDVDLGRDFVGYRQAAIFASDAEIAALVSEIRTLLAPYAGTAASPERRRRILTTVLLLG